MGDRQGKRNRTRQQAKSSKGRARGEAEAQCQEQPLGKYVRMYHRWISGCLPTLITHPVPKWKSGMSSPNARSHLPTLIAISWALILSIIYIKTPPSTTTLFAPLLSQPSPRPSPFLDVPYVAMAHRHPPRQPDRDVRMHDPPPPAVHSHPHNIISHPHPHPQPPHLNGAAPIPSTPTTLPNGAVHPNAISPAVAANVAPNGAPTAPPTLVHKLAAANEQTWLLIGLSQFFFGGSTVRMLMRFMFDFARTSCRANG